MIAFLRLMGFYVCAGSFAHGPQPVVVVKDKAVLDANAAALERGVQPGMTLREAKAILHDGKFVEWEPDEYREAQCAWLDLCAEFTDVVEPEEQHTAYLDLSMHPNPGEILDRVTEQLGHWATRQLGGAYSAGFGARDAGTSPLERGAGEPARSRVNRGCGLGGAELDVRDGALDAVSRDAAELRDPGPCGPDTSIPNPFHPASRGKGLGVQVGVAHVKWLAKAALLAGDTSQLAYRYPKLFLAELPTALLAPVAPEHRERLSFLGYKRVGLVAELPLEVLRSQFGEESISIHRAAHGGVAEKVRALYPLRCVSARFSFESPVESLESLENGMSVLARKLSERLLADDMQGCDLRVDVGFDEGPGETLERNFAKPMRSAASVLFGLKQTFRQLPDGVCDAPEPRPRRGRSEMQARIVSLRVQMPNLVHATRKQSNLYTLKSQERLHDAEIAFTQMRQTFGSDAVLSAAQMPEPRRKRVLKAWKDALGWT